MISMKKLAIAAVPALALAFAAASGAQAQGIQCAPADVMKQAVVDQFNDTATGEKGANDAWNLEIYADAADGSWSILGEPKGDDVPEGLLCYLGGADEGYPDEVKAQTWYQQIFAPKP